MRISALCLSAGLIGLAACTTPPAPSNTQITSTSPAKDLGRTGVVPIQVEDAYYETAAASVAARANGTARGQAKNIILFIGDGMGISTITAGRIYAGQTRGLDGESYRLAMETLPHLALSKTYAHDGQVSDSASTATAIVSGAKVNLRTLGITSDAAYNNCASMAGHGTDTIFELAERAGLATGILSTARLTHATPASTYAEIPNRDWEDDTAFRGQESGGCADIASQFIDWREGDGFEIAMGGGRRHFLTTDVEDPESEGSTGRRGDGRDLTAAWTEKSPEHRVIYGRAGFDATNFDSETRVLGLFEPSHMQYELDRANDTLGEPSLAEMTAAAITRLSRDPDGFVLMVEGGRIDHAHHGTNAARAVSDTDALDQAVAMALEMTSAEDTLIIVTADHSHTLTLAGYPRRNNPILGKATLETGEELKGADGQPYTTLGYMNGPGACAGRDEADGACVRQDLSDVDTTAPDFRQPALIPMYSETHAGEDVAIFASGPGSQLVSGVMEQNEIFHVMGHASGLVAIAE
ncbi:MAG: alkaline phosphatase [Hyphomonadaceae bacterium]|nr:alkaline phosphatase [Hyphomonadaceae bacterium]